MKAGSKTSLKAERQRRTNNSCQFIVKLLQMMKSYPNNVKWSEDGSYVEFIDLNVIQNSVIPTFFRHRNMLSFIRQLNMYYFSKLDSDDENIMKFKHNLFRQGNEDNFHLISRRNKTRDQIIGNIQKNYESTLEYLKQQNRISEQTKSLIRMGIEYHSISIKNLKKIKCAIEDLTEHLKTVRSKQLKKALSKLKQHNLVELQRLIESYKSLDGFIKQCLCRDLASKSQQVIPSLPSNIGLLDEPGTIKQMDLNNKVFNFRSQCSILQFQSQECSIQRNLREQDQQISLQQDIKQQSEN